MVVGCSPLSARIKRLAGQYGMANHPLLSPEDLEQVGNEVILRSCSTYRPEWGGFLNYASFRVRGAMQDAWRHEGRGWKLERIFLDDYVEEDNVTMEELTPDPGADDPAEVALYRCLAAQACRILSLAPVRTRLCLRLLYWGDLDVAEVAAILGVSSNRVVQIHQAALRSLRLLLEGGCFAD